MPDTTATTWTKPHCSTQHLETADRRHRCTVVEYSADFAELSRWYPGCGFNPIHSRHGSAAEARASGEKWLSTVEA